MDIVTKSPIGEKIVVWVITKLPSFISKIIGKSLLTNMEKKITIKNQKASIYLTQAYPYLLFEFEVDSKAQIDFKIKELTAHVYHQSAFMSKIHWSPIESKGSAIDANYEYDVVDDVKALGEGSVRLFYCPPLEVYKINSDRWHLEIFINFSTKLGDVYISFTCNLHIPHEQIEQVKDKFSSLFK